MPRTLGKALHFALLHSWDPMVPDRWRWLGRHLPETRAGERLLDVGCGTGTFTMGAALRGYRALGLTWDDAQRERAERRNEKLGAGADFRALDVRELDRADDLVGRFSVVVLCEVIEHVLDDARLMRAVAACLEPGGRLLLTTPNLDYRPIVPEHAGPFSEVENGEHVRRGYSASHLIELCERESLRVEELSACSGVISQKASWVTYTVGRKSANLARVLTGALHPLVPVLDPVVTRALDWPPYSLCVVAVKPRFAVKAPSGSDAAEQRFDRARLVPVA